MSMTSDKATIMHEHNSVLLTKYLLAIFNFAAILVGSVLTLAFTLYRGATPIMTILCWVQVALNAAMLGVCIADFVLQRIFGSYRGVFLWSSWVLGVLWLGLLVGRIVCGISEIDGHTMRIDLIAIAGVQLLIAFLAYFVWPSLDRHALDAMMRRSVRGDADKRKKKAIGFCVLYAAVCAVITLAQFGSLLFYKLPPTVYDLFAGTRALEYRLVDEGEGYEVTDVYVGTAKKVNVPATFNNLPVVGIASGALTASNITTIELGTAAVNEAGESVLVSNLRYISSGAIKNDRITELRIPESVETLESDAVAGTSLKQILYEARADFRFSCIDCPNLTTVTMNGDSVGRIVSLDGIGDAVTIRVDKSIYNEYRNDNPEYTTRFKPLMDEDEFCIDFYTGCDYYIDSIFATEPVTLDPDDLIDPARDNALSIDTKAYYADKFEVNTNGAKKNAAFRGWYADKGFTEECRLSPSYTVWHDLSLYAKWVDEYSATLDWGNYVPTTEEEVWYRFGGVRNEWDPTGRTVYWTDEAECKVTFPDVDARLGYDGVQWKRNNADVSTSDDIRSGDTIRATWLLTAPTVDIECTPLNGQASDYFYDETNNDLSFTYDEKYSVNLGESHDHPLTGPTVISYTYQWKKKGSDQTLSTAANYAVRRVPASGVYTLTVTAKSEKYGETSSASADISVEIKKKDLDVGSAYLQSSVECDYDGQKHYYDLKETESLENLNLTYVYEYRNDAGGRVSFAQDSASSASVTNAGTYELMVTIRKKNLEEAENYNEKSWKMTITIKPKSLTISKWEPSWGAENKVTYDGEEKSVKAVFDGLCGADDPQAVYTNERATDHGTRTARVTALNNLNYTCDFGSATYLWIIEPKLVEITGWTGTDGLVYNGAAHEIKAEIGHGSGEKQICEVDRGKVILSLSDNSKTDAGTYTARAVLAGAGSDNYELSETNASKTWTIAKQTLHTSKKTTNVTYDGTLQTMFGVEVTGFAAKDISLVKSAAIGELFDFGATTAGVEKFAESSESEQTVRIEYRVTDAGEYRCEFNGLGTADVIKNYEIGDSRIGENVTVGKLELTVSPSGSYVYNGATQRLTVRVRGIASADRSKLVLTDFRYEGFTLGAIEGEDFLLIREEQKAGDYEVTVDPFQASDKLYKNYTVSNKTMTLKIEKRTLKITGWTLNGGQGSSIGIVSGGDLTYTGDAYRIAPVVSGVQGGDTVTLSLTVSEAKDAKSYTTTATLGDAYTDYTLDSSNQTLNFTIKPCVLTVSFRLGASPDNLVNDVEYTYDGAVRTITAVVTPLKNDDVHVGITLHASAKDAGTYEIKGSDLALEGAQADNYKLNVASGDTAFRWSIRPAQVTIRWKKNADEATWSEQYNGESQGPSFEIDGIADADRADSWVCFTYGEFGGGQQSKVVSCKDSVIGTESAGIKNAGQYVVSVSYIYKSAELRDGNYNVTPNTMDFWIIARWVYVTKEWTWTDGSDSGKLDGDLVYRGKPYTVTTEIDENSVLEADRGALTLVYSGKTQTDVTAASSAYTVRITGLSGENVSNYQLAETVSKSWRIVPKPVSFEWDPEGTLTYNGKSQSVHATLAVQDADRADDSDNKVCYDDRDQVRLVYQNEKGTDATTYEAKVTALTGTKSGNYTLTQAALNKTHTWTIKPLTIKASQMTWSADELVYNGKIQAPTAYYMYSSQRVDVSGYDTDGITRDVGSKTVRITGLANGNFEIDPTDNSHSFRITPLQIEVSWLIDGAALPGQTGSFNYDGETHTVSATVTNAKSNDVLTCTFDGQTGLKDAAVYVLTITGLTGAGSGNYELGSSDSVLKRTITVNQRELYFSWAPQADLTYSGRAHTVSGPTIPDGLICHGDTVRIATYDYGNGDGVDVKGATSVALTDAGTYTVTVASLGGSSASNYKIGNSGRTQSVTVGKRAVTIKWTGDCADGTSVTYKSENGTAKTYKLTAEVLGVDNTTLTSHSVTRSDYGETPLNVKIDVPLDNKNYTYDSVPDGDLTKTLTVLQQKVRIVWTLDGQPFDGEPIVADGAKHTLTATVTGVADVGENPEIRANITPNGDFTSEGTHSVTVTSLANNNYTLQGAEGDLTKTLTISPAPAAAEAADGPDLRFVPALAASAAEVPLRVRFAATGGIAR